MAEWLFEQGIGEARAALVERGVIVEAHVEPDDIALRAGTIAEARLTEILIPGRRGLVSCAGDEALLEPLPKGLTKGATVRIEIVREAIVEPGAVKRAKARAAPQDCAAKSGPTLLERVTASAIPVRHVSVYDPDLLERAGWSECLEAAAQGVVGFDGGTLRISLTPAMTLIDVDGHLTPAPLAVAAAAAAAGAIRRFDISGSIGIDFPTLANKGERLAATAAFDATLPLPFERTAINGFGFMQIIRPRTRASLCERLRYDRIGSAARGLMRRAERSGITGAAEIRSHSAEIAQINAHPDWLVKLGAQLGGAVRLRPDSMLAIGAGYVAKA